VALLRWLSAHGPATVSEAARGRGGSRQASQRLADELGTLGWLERLPNPAHRRAARWRLTAEGHRVLADLEEQQTSQANAWADGLDAAEVHAARRLLAALRRRRAEAASQSPASGGAGRTSPS